MAYKVEPTVGEVFARFFWALKHTFVQREKLSPYVIDGEGDLKPVARTGWQDLGHAFENIGVELWRKLKRVVKAGIERI